MLSKETIETKLQAQIPNFYHALVTDTSNGCGQSFDVVVISDFFHGKNKLSRCRMVNKALAEEIAEVHAFGAKCYTVEEWNALLN